MLRAIYKQQYNALSIFAYNLLWRKLLERVPLKMMGRYMGQKSN